MEHATAPVTPSVPQLAPEAKAFLGKVLNEYGPRDPGRPLEEIRAESRAIAKWCNGTPEAVESTEDIDAGGVRARLYRPTKASTDVLVYFHGGGWILGDIDDDDTMACAIANRAGCNVLSVDYRLAPEHPYPAAINDCWTATKWALREFGAVAVGGDSAGGNLAAAVALRARDSGLRLTLQLLVYAALDATLQSPAYAEFAARSPALARDADDNSDPVAGLRRVWEMYIPNPEQRADPYASPLRAESLTGLAPAVIVLAEHDLLRSEGEEYADRLVASGVPVELHVYEGQIHGFYTILGAMDDGWAAIEKTSVALRAAFESTGQKGLTDGATWE